MSHTRKTFLISLTVAVIGVSATLTAFSAPKPDAPEIVAKPKTANISAKLKAKSKYTRIVIGHAKKAMPTGLKAVVIDEPNSQDGTISVVTENKEFATINTTMGTRFARGYQLAGLRNIHPGYTVRCQGAWDRDGFQYQASSVALGNSVSDTDVVNWVNSACKNIGKARKGGGFGKSLVAMVPPTALPKAISIGDRKSPAPAATPAPIPASLIPNQAPTAPMPSTPNPNTPAPMTPIDPQLLPPTVPYTPIVPGL